MLVYWSGLLANAALLELGQSIDRVFKDDETCSPCLTPKDFFWLVEASRIVYGCEHMAIQWWPMELLMDMMSKHIFANEHLFRDLAGNSFAAASFLAVVVAAFTELPSLLDLGEVVQTLIDGGHAMPRRDGEDSWSSEDDIDAMFAAA